MNVSFEFANGSLHQPETDPGLAMHESGQEGLVADSVYQTRDAPAVSVHSPERGRGERGAVIAAAKMEPMAYVLLHFVPGKR